jgi:hypothetical protein
MVRSRRSMTTMSPGPVRCCARRQEFPARTPTSPFEVAVPDPTAVRAKGSPPSDHELRSTSRPTGDAAARGGRFERSPAARFASMARPIPHGVDTPVWRRAAWIGESWDSSEMTLATGPRSWNAAIPATCATVRPGRFASGFSRRRAVVAVSGCRSPVRRARPADLRWAQRTTSHGERGRRANSLLGRGTVTSNGIRTV